MTGRLRAEVGPGLSGEGPTPQISAAASAFRLKAAPQHRVAPLGHMAISVQGSITMYPRVQSLHCWPGKCSRLPLLEGSETTSRRMASSEQVYY